MENQENKSVKLAIFCFKYSLIIGTLFFLSFCITRYGTLAFYGLIYTCVATVINLIVLLILLFTLSSNRVSRLQAFKSIGLLLVNIPIAFLYFWIILSLNF